MRSNPTPTPQSQHSSQAFTIVELLIVIVVIGILAAITIVAYNGIQSRAKEATLKSDIRQATNQLELANASSGSYPTSIGDIASSAGNEYYYTGGGGGYCITVTDGDSAFHRTSGGTILPGACLGHPDPSGGGGLGLNCPDGFIEVPGSSQFGTPDFCVMKYEPKNDNGLAVSRPEGTPWGSITQPNAIIESEKACDGCGLITEAQWLTIAHNVLNVAANWTGGSVGSGSLYRGHSDNAPNHTLAASSNDSDGYYGTGNSAPSEQRRTLILSNGEVIWDFAGNAFEYTMGGSGSAQPGVVGGGSAWRNWNEIEGSGSVSPNPFPSYGTPSATNWGSDQGLGMVYSNNASNATNRPFRRGGRYYNGERSGVFSLTLDGGLTGTATDLTFRATRQ